jgi:hypothetical protein
MRWTYTVAVQPGASVSTLDILFRGLPHDDADAVDTLPLGMRYRHDTGYDAGRVGPE